MAKKEIKKKNVNIVKITVSIGNKDIELTIDEAKELQEQLNTFLYNSKEVEVVEKVVEKHHHHYNPQIIPLTPYEPKEYPWYPKPIREQPWFGDPPYRRSDGYGFKTVCDGPKSICDSGSTVSIC